MGLKRRLSRESAIAEGVEFVESIRYRSGYQHGTR